ncbi:glutamate racemase [Acetitomaculum ruminis DSM 5522]|uniref:Glutamate racemase n=1 Tax=Acetitomaculum ruminis DSM 5522 TaxID=1120918 RepID=A0A1I0XDU3_9FIRM|nr:glutamate racemase [Acetitomaculum ruminis]SFA98877.1 glutamate racemase [Acetitomaculum ruminis DSM 5522]
MNKENNPIGVFDSGLGGLSTLRECLKIMPNENYIYFGDSKNAPYGIKTVEEVRSLTLKNIELLVKENAKAIVVACNTATSAAILDLRKEYKDIPVIGMEPALKPAVNFKKNPKVLVLATDMTLKEEKFHNLMEEYKDRAEIIKRPLTGLVEFIERGDFLGEEIEAYLEKELGEYKEKVDCAVLGCTHFPFAKDAISLVLGKEVKLFDGAEGTAKQLYNKLQEAGTLNLSGKRGSVRFYKSFKEQMEVIKRGKFLPEETNIL